MAAENDGRRPQLVETHISWVILTDKLVYKIKKPLTLHFLDFSTREKRKFYCERELMLNKRLTENIYLEVLPVKEKAGRLLIGHQSGETVDHAVCMRRMEEGRRMDLLVRSGGVNEADMRQLAEKIALFHSRTDRIFEKDVMDIPDKFTDLASEEEHLQKHPGICNAGIISRAIDISNDFMNKHRDRVAARLKAGFFRDCHGDLHTRNIFMLRVPQPFDCIEFNDDLRQIDVLNEVAFLCMDLDALGRQDLSASFLRAYNELFPAIVTTEDYLLFIYFKSYRANVRAKINSLRARSADNEDEKAVALAASDKYLGLMDAYLKQLS
jgi:aminoglycoside phosphotransferase family enzyme